MWHSELRGSLPALCLLICLGGAANAQPPYNLTLTRVAGPQDPRVNAPRAQAGFQMTNNEQNSATNTQDTYAYQNAGAQIGTGTASIVTEGTSQCLTATGFTTLSAQVDTLVYTQATWQDWGWLNYNNATDVKTLFNVRYSNSDVTTAQLDGSFYMFGFPGFIDQYANGVIIFAQVGTSNLGYVHQNGAWARFYILQGATLANPTAQPTTAMGEGVGASFEDWVSVSEVVAVPSVNPVVLEARIDNGTIDERFGGASNGIESGSFSLEFKASGEFHVTTPTAP